MKTLTFQLRDNLGGLLQNWSISGTKDYTTPFEFLFHAMVPDNFDRTNFIDDPNERNLEDSSADANLDPRHTGQGQEFVPNPVMFARFLLGSHSLVVASILHHEF